MKDITRIHIAKVPYNVELSAKKELEKYIAAVEAYTDDAEVVSDIEIRITELLLERGIKQDDVISDSDVASIREQLGEPKEFMTDDVEIDFDTEVVSNGTARKLYRDLDNALVGGVLSGIGRYFKINPLWVQLAFIALTFISFGLSVLLYLVLWVVIPPARTAAEKLQMAGRPVTLKSIRELNESSIIQTRRRSAITKRLATISLGILSIFGALLISAWLVFALFGVSTGYANTRDWLVQYYLVPFILGIAASVCLLALSILVAVASFTQKFNKRIWISGIVIIVFGLSTFAAALITYSYQQGQHSQEIQRNTVETALKLPEDFKTVKSLSVDVSDVARVVYVVDDSVTSLTQRTYKQAPQVKVTVVSGVAKVSLTRSESELMIGGSTITIYGPRLESILLSNGALSYNSGSQTSLKTEVYNSASLRLVGSRIDELTARTDGGAQLSAEEAAVSSAKVSIYGASSVALGNIKALNVINPDVCASNQTAQLTVQDMVNPTYVRNDKEVGSKTTKGPCLDIVFAKDSYYGQDN